MILSKLIAILFYLFLLLSPTFSIYAQSATDDDADLELPPVITAAEQKIDSLAVTVKKLGRFIDKLDSATILNMPFGITGKGDNPSYSVMLDTITFKSDRAYFNASMKFVCPNDGSTLAFRAENVPLTKTGGLTDPIRLKLVSQKNIKISKDIYLTVLPGSQVEWDCHGFKSMQLKARLTLSRKTFIPVDPDGKDLPGRVSAFFETTLYDWNDLTLSLSLDPFRLKKLPDMFFTCQNIALDFSDFSNPSNLVFPANYQSLYPEGNINLWRGLFIGKAEVKLGKKFQRKNNKNPTSFSATNLIIDENGFTGELAATNLLGLNEGNMSGWAFSLEYLSVKLQQSEITAAGLRGQVHVPAFKDGTNFSYSAFIDNQGSYNFTVQPGKDLPFTLFGSSSLTLYKTSFIEIQGVGDNFVPTANLSGELNVNCGVSANPADSSKNKMKLVGVKFEEMRISTREPMFTVKRFAVDGNMPGTFSNFPLTIKSIGIRNNNTKFCLDFTVAINLTKSSEEGFSGSTSLTLNGERNGNNFEFKGITVREIRVDIVKPSSFEIHGQVAFAHDDAIYGNGFRGALQAKFADKFELGAVAVFGTVQGTRYFFVDAMFAMKPGIPAGVINLTGFSGGLYNHMRQKTGTIDPHSFGASLSGLVYEPDPQIGIGVMAGVKFNVTSDKVINAEARFEIVFNSSGGLNRIGFDGNAQCITPEVPIDAGKMGALAAKLTGGKKLTFVPEGAISLTLSMIMDFQNHSFHAEFATYVNVGPVLKGVGENGKAGWGVIHIAPEKWYIHIGTPTDPIGLSFLGLAKTKSYFMVGHDIPTSLPLNPKVVSILNLDPAKFCDSREDNKLSKGKGFAFGTSIEISTGDLSFLIFYGSFELGAGFDMMLVDFGKDSYCAGHQPPLGINGWYAKGQAYAYVSGKIGLQAKLFGKTKRFEILSIAAAALLRAEGPNPVWLFGAVGGQYRILGGMIKGSCKFEMSVGERCEMVSVNKTGVPPDLTIISDITPRDNNLDVNVFTLPQVVFNMPINRKIKYAENEASSRTFRMVQKKLSLLQNGNELSCEVKWNADQTVAVLEPVTLFNPKTSYTVSVEIGLEEDVNGSWRPMMENGKVYTEIRNVSFTTGTLPDKIPASEIAYSYPVDRQYNFYPKEYHEAYIHFHRDLAPFFTDDEEYTREAQWISSDGKKISGTFQYKAGEKTVHIPIPSNLIPNKIYSLNMAALIKAADDNIDKNVSIHEENIALDSSSSVTKTTKEASGTITQAGEKKFITINFRVSNFAKFKDKFGEDQKDVKILYRVNEGEYYLGTTFRGNEMFDKFEIFGHGGTPPLIRRSAVLTGTDWYKNEIQPLLYKYYSPLVRWRDSSICGVPPRKDIQIWQQNFNHILDDNEIASGIPSVRTDFAHLIYTMPYYWCEDYSDVRTALAYGYVSGITIDPTTQSEILNNFLLRPVKPGLYPLKLEYVLPGTGIVTTSKVITFNNKFKTHSSDY
jgi:hypothetical protein